VSSMPSCDREVGLIEACEAPQALDDRRDARAPGLDHAVRIVEHLQRRCQLAIVRVRVGRDLFEQTAQLRQRARDRVLHARDRADRRVDLVRDAGDQHSERRHLLRLHELSLCLAQVLVRRLELGERFLQLLCFLEQALFALVLGFEELARDLLFFRAPLLRDRDLAELAHLTQLVLEM
jgi:hypothetical protein